MRRHGWIPRIAAATPPPIPAANRCRDAVSKQPALGRSTIAAIPASSQQAGAQIRTFPVSRRYCRHDRKHRHWEMGFYSRNEILPIAPGRSMHPARRTRMAHDSSSCRDPTRRACQSTRRCFFAWLPDIRSAKSASADETVLPFDRRFRGPSVARPCPPEGPFRSTCGTPSRGGFSARIR